MGQIKKPLENDVVRLRGVESGDVDFLYEIESDTSLWIYSNHLSPITREAIAMYALNYDDDPLLTDQWRLMIEDAATNETYGIIDLVGIDRKNSRAKVGIFVSEQARGKGIAHNALEVLVHYCREVLDLHQLAAEVMTDNEPSLRLFHGCGFKQCGLIKDWHKSGRRYCDIQLFQLLL